jgi:hypothetical protein
MGCGASKVEGGSGGEGPLPSVIVPSFPSVLEEFRKKKFILLWRGTRDGFSARAFHGRGDGHPNTLTLILDTNGNIFGGYTPIPWSSRTRDPYQEDSSQKSFIFTIKNPVNAKTAKFALKPGSSKSAIGCDYSWGPTFGEGDIFVANDCNANSLSYTRYFGDTYKNASGYARDTFLTGGLNFTVKEIELWEISDRDAVAPPAVAPVVAGDAAGSPDSVILSEIPEIFSDFAGKRFALLWRGSRDGVNAAAFHARADGHQNTLTIIKDVNDNVFGGFTPVAWESPPFAQSVADNSGKSWLFSIKNPSGTAPARYPLKPTSRESAIWSDALAGPSFDDDIAVHDGENGHSNFGTSYRNETNVPGTTFFAGVQCFTVKDIEIFEIID